jgi:hypothetical protein
MTFEPNSILPPRKNSGIPKIASMYKIYILQAHFVSSSKTHIRMQNIPNERGQTQKTHPVIDDRLRRVIRSQPRLHEFTFTSYNLQHIVVAIDSMCQTKKIRQNRNRFQGFERVRYGVGELCDQSNNINCMRFDYKIEVC